MKLKKEATVVRYAMRDKTFKEAVDSTRAYEVVNDLCADMPEIKADTLDEADAVAKRVMDWIKSLSSKKVQHNLSYHETLIAVGMLTSRVDAMHLQLEQLLYDMGVVERGQTDTQETDSA